MPGVVTLLLILNWATGAFVLSWCRWYFDNGPDKLWQRMLEEALWPIAMSWGTYKRLRMRGPR